MEADGYIGVNRHERREVRHLGRELPRSKLPVAYT